MKPFIFLVVVAILVAGWYFFVRDAGELAQPLPRASATMTMPTTSGVPVTASPSVSPAPTAGTRQVEISGFAFSSASLTVKKGDKIVFTNRDSAAHTATADGGAFASPTLGRDQSWTLDTATLAAGTYAYHCALHPSMHGTVIVQ